MKSDTNDSQNEQRPLRLLFVGGDFVRKGGDLLLRVFEERFADRCELDIVTRDQVQGAHRARIHRAETNSPELRRLFQQADVFVLPTRAECFGIAYLEAMASGLPVIAGNVGGVSDIVENGKTGWLISPNEGSLSAAIEKTLSSRQILRAMGTFARNKVERDFDGARNDKKVVNLILDRFAMRDSAELP
jgi:glycosyltransferase involved in cell wall biosynthesis